ncbi:MAG TPA: PhoU family transcriptional regulator [Thermoplasmatales archaeon]|nr:PhoU family transcriptional regulator [Thermoplasmatales archaeon]HEX17276.1 PhoU family transcriptional regulator [Thermoplasmatales archaeon]
MARVKREVDLEDLILEVKDKSELMVDLAYSSLIYDNRRIAEEVYDLEDYVDSLHQTVYRLILNKLRKGEIGVDESLILLRLVDSGEQIADAAREIADVELRDVELHPILRESIRESDTVFSRVEVSSDSILCNKTLGEIKLASKTGMTVIAIRRGDRWKYGPGGDTKIMAGDILFAKGPEEGEKELVELASGRKKKI